MKKIAIITIINILAMMVLLFAIRYHYHFVIPFAMYTALISTYIVYVLAEKEIKQKK